MIDLHTHTTESDGSLTPAQLIDAAARAGIRHLAITDHDTFAGYDASLENAKRAGIRLICGIEISTKLHGHSAHLLGYFQRPNGLSGFRTWIRDMQASRRERNIRLAARLKELGFDVPLEEAEALGRGMTGRPHFAQVMLRKGYVDNLRQAFDLYLDESACAYVYRREPKFEEAVQAIRETGGIASLAHPGRVKANVQAAMPELCAAGLNAIEAYHSDHTPEETELYLGLADRFGLKVTGGSDFHGAVKPEVELGSGCGGNLRIPPSVLENLRP